MNSDDALQQFWAEARTAHPELPEHRPEAWAFGATPSTPTGCSASCSTG